MTAGSPMESRVRSSLGRRPYLQQSVPFAVLAVGCTLTAIAVTTIATRERTATASAFRSDTLAVQRVVQVQLDTLASVTHAASALLAANPEINLVEFRAFIAELQLRERYPGLEGIGFAPSCEPPRSMVSRTCAFAPRDRAPNISLPCCSIRRTPTMPR